MREILAQTLEETIAQMCVESNRKLPQDIASSLAQKQEEEDSPLGQETLALLQENIKIAQECTLPVCQDTGMVSVYVKLGQDVHIQGNFQESIQRGVAKGYADGLLRMSMVGDPLKRTNTEDNTPASITVELVQGEGCSIQLMPKGFGSENMSQLKMLKPADGVEAVVKFVLDVIESAGSNACPPMVVGVGIGGNFEKAPYYAKKALLRPIGEAHPDPFYAQLEQRLEQEANALGIGAQGFGGRTTVLAVQIEKGGTHVAGLPVAVNIGCHVMRRVTRDI